MVLHAVLQPEVHHRQVHVLLEPVLRRLEDLQLLGLVVLQVLAQVARLGHALQVELLLQHEQRRVDARVFGGDVAQLSGDLNAVVVGHQSAHCCLVLDVGDLEVVLELGLLALGNCQFDLLVAGSTSVGPEHSCIRGDKYVFVEFHHDLVDVCSALPVVHCSLDVHRLSFVAHVS